MGSSRSDGTDRAAFVNVNTMESAAHRGTDRAVLIHRVEKGELTRGTRRIQFRSRLTLLRHGARGWLKPAAESMGRCEGAIRHPSYHAVSACRVLQFFGAIFSDPREIMSRALALTRTVGASNCRMGTRWEGRFAIARGRWRTPW
jgi:hypothetical protein